MVDVVLVNSNFGGGRDGFVNMAPPPGLGYIAAVLESQGIDVNCDDPIPEGLSKSDVVERINQLNPKVVGLTCLTSYRYDVFELADLIKMSNPERKILVGGAHVSFLDTITLEKIKSIDAIVRGEGEYTCLEYVNAVLTDGTFSDILGLTYKEKWGEIIQNPNRPLIDNLDTLPFPAYHLFPTFDKYAKLHEIDNPVSFSNFTHAPMVSSRGCPYNCLFCSSSVFWNRRFRARSAKNVVDEIQYLVDKFGIEYIRFYDDNFTVNKKRVIEICDEILKRNIRIKWRCESRIGGVDRGILERMAEAGCHEVEYGVETGSKKIMKKINKGINLAIVPNVARMTKECGLEAKAFFIIGLPGETIVDFKQTLKISKHFDYCGVGPLMIFPGSPLYIDMKSKGALDDNIWFEFRSNIFGDGILDNIPVYTESFSPGCLPELINLFYEHHALCKLSTSLVKQIKSLKAPQKIFQIRKVLRLLISPLLFYKHYRKIRKDMKRC